MNVHSLTIVHYGKNYLPYALRSIYHSVDQCHVFFTPNPSHGHTTETPPIETREQIMEAAYAYNPDDKIRWYDTVGIRQEGVQRDMALEYVRKAGADVVVVLDCDEIWPEGLLDRFLQRAVAYNYHHNLVNMLHFWRSFNYACSDNGWPVRIINLAAKNEGVKYLETEIGRVYHFGYAVTDQVMNYKWLIHGHKNELRPNWFNDYWKKWPPVADCHPTNDNNFWQPEPFDKTQLPEFMRDHPFYDLEVIR